MTSLKVFLVSFVLVFTIGLIATAQEIPPGEETPEGVGGGYSPVVTAQEAVNLDEDIQPEDLGISEPRLLPDSPFYFLKNWARGIQNFFTFDPIKKAELRLKISNEKLMEAKKITEKTENPEIIKKATENYQQEIEEIKNQVEKIKEKAKDNPEVEKFLDKFINQQILHQKLLQKLENQVPPEAFEKIKEARERHLENFRDVMLKLEDRQDKITEKLNEILESQKGSLFKNFKNLEVLKNLEEKVPEEAKEAIRKAQENALKRLQENLEKISPEDQDKFKEYLEKISGEKEKQMEILENLKTKIKEAPETPKILELKKKLEEGKEKIFEKIEKGLEKPEVIEAVCITLWDPVCGKDGKTYSNECFAELAGVKIDYKGECKEKELEKEIPAEGETLWWFDDTHRYCQQKRFIGFYMYKSLRTFETKEECETALQLQIKSESYCRTDADCACGVKKNTKECFSGNREYVDETIQCPDFCSGITGNLRIRCIQNECRQVQASE